MRKLVLEEWLSLDGFAADKAGKLDYLRLKRVSVRTYDTGVVYLHYEPRREADG